VFGCFGHMGGELVLSTPNRGCSSQRCAPVHPQSTKVHRLKGLVHLSPPVPSQSTSPPLSRGWKIQVLIFTSTPPTHKKYLWQKKDRKSVVKGKRLGLRGRTTGTGRRLTRSPC